MVKVLGKHILCTVDFRDDWVHVVRHAAVHARHADAKLHVLHIMEGSGSKLFELLGKKEFAKHNESVAAEVRERIGAALEEVAADLKTEVHVAEGKPSKEILHAADRIKAGLIVLGASVAVGLEKLFVGTTADRVVRHSKVPTLVVGFRAPGKIKRILVPTDLDRGDEGALRVAASLGIAHKARVSALHVIAEPSLQSRYLGNVASIRKELRAQAKARFQEFVEGVELPEGAKAPHKVLVANPDAERVAETIQTDAVRLNIDLIVMALGGTSFFESHVIGSTAEHLLRGLPCDFLALPQKWARRR